jgi:hypothetical protein
MSQVGSDASAWFKAEILHPYPPSPLSAALFTIHAILYPLFSLLIFSLTFTYAQV